MHGLHGLHARGGARVLALLVLVLATQAHARTCAVSAGAWSTCDDDPGDVAVASLAFTPQPAPCGARLDVRVAGRAPAPLEHGTVRMRVMMGPFTAREASVDLCAALRAGGAPCPLPAGDFAYTIGADLPTAAAMPAGRYRVEYRAQDAHGQTRLCLQFPLTVS